MQLAVMLLLVLSVVTTASALAISDQNMDTEDIFKLDERELETEVEGDAAVGISKKGCRLVCEWLRCRWKCTRNEIPEEASALAISDQELDTGDYFKLDESELQTKVKGDAAVGISKKWCKKVCARWTIFRVCIGWRIRCRRNEIPDEAVQLPINSIKSTELQQWENQPSEAQPDVTRRGSICVVCARWSIFRVCLVCLKWSFKRTLDIDEKTPLSALDNGLTISEEEEKTAVAMLESESQTAFRNLYDEKVVKAEKYEIPASFLGTGATQEKTVDSVIITLEDRRRFVVMHGKEMWNGKSSAILKEEDLTDIWKLKESKSIQFSTVADYIRVSDSSESSREAAEKMMELD